MNDGTLGFVTLIGLLALNRLVLSIAGYGTWRALFWGIQFLNLGASIALIIWGLPGLPPGFWLVNWFIALLFMWHIVENNGKRVKHLRQNLAGAQEQREDDDRRSVLRERMRSGGADEPADKTTNPGPPA